jgi:hypothetical protein
MLKHLGYVQIQVLVVLLAELIVSHHSFLIDNVPTNTLCHYAQSHTLWPQASDCLSSNAVAGLSTSTCRRLQTGNLERCQADVRTVRVPLVTAPHALRMRMPLHLD